MLNGMNEKNTTPRSLFSGRWLVVVLLGAILAAMVFMRYPPSAPPEDEMEPLIAVQEVAPNTRGGVTLAMEIAGEPDLNAPQLSFAPSEAVTLYDAMRSLAERHDRWKFESVDRGKDAMLTQLAGKENEGAGGRNWLYEVNGEWAQQSFGAYYPLPGDRVLWKFAPSE